MSAEIRHTAGARFALFQASRPFVALTADARARHLACLDKTYDFEKSRVRKLSRQRGAPSVGLRIEHVEGGLPEFVVFWASVFFRTSGYQRLSKDLEGIGHEIAA